MSEPDYIQILEASNSQLKAAAVRVGDDQPNHIVEVLLTKFQCEFLVELIDDSLRRLKSHGRN